MLQDKEEKLDNNEVSFVPDETNNTTESGDALFVPDKKQPNLLSADISEIEKSQNAGGFMKFLTDVITADVQLQNKMDITKGELISGGVEGVAEATLTQPADIAASTLQVVGDLTDSKGISEFGKEMSNTVKSFNEFIEKDWITKDESIDPKIKQIARVMGAGGGQVLQMQGIAKSLGGAFTYALYTVPDASDVYLGYRKEGYGKTEAGTAGIATGAGFYAIDRFFDGAKLMNGMKNTSLGLLDVLLEPTAEMSQEAYKNMIFKIGPEKTRDLMSGVIESGIGGLAGGMVGSASVSINGVEYNPNTNYETARQEALDAGATEEDVNNLMAEMYTNIDSNPEKVSKYLTDLANKNAEQITSMIREMPKSVAYQSVNDFYKTVDEFITANEGTQEAERAKQTKTELDNVYKDTYSALENLMPKQEADANARLVQGHALFASQEFGVSPKTYMDTMFAKVEQGGEDFLGETAQMQEQLDVAQRINEIDEEERAKGVPEYTAPTININGVERQTTNSNGTPIAKSEKSLRYFYDWFGDSKVVDEQGRPLVVYHGSKDSFEDFSKEKIGTGKGYVYGRGFYFTNREEGAKKFSGGFFTENKSGVIYPVYLKIENMYESSSVGAIPDEYDGRIVQFHGTEEGTKWFVVKEPNQIKSTSNRGTFSSSENIYLQSAYAGSRVDYDRPSLEAIGSGEGNQAHGWGLYYALNKDVAEGYRETFTQDKFVLKYGDKTYTKEDGAIFDALSDTWFAGSKEDALDGLQTRLDLKQYEDLDERDDIKNAIEFLKGVDENKIELAPQGQVHEVDIPESPYLLDEQKGFNEQSEFVKENLEKAFNKLTKEQRRIIVGDETTPVINMLKWKTGGEIYKSLSSAFGSKKATSEFLYKNKIKGITYFGSKDGRCFVIFNPDDVKVIQKFYQDETNPRGAYYRGIIHLFQNADPSTFVHESMHFYKEELMKMKDKSAKAKSILETLESFASNEFAKNYVVMAKGGRYFVADKNGRTVYDKQGKLFETVDEAREYAKDEIISRGFEQYVREGKSPSKFLTRAFHSFMNWLKHIYKSAKDLGVELNDSVRQAYGDLLGGQDLDYWMGQPEEAIISEVQSVEQDRKKYLDDVINQAVKEKGTKVSEGRGRGFRDIWTRSMIPLSTRAKRVSPLLQTRLRRFEFSLANNLNKKYDLSRPFLDIWKNMSEEDAIAFDLALKNDYVEKQQELVAKYNATEQWAKIKGVLADIYTDAIGVGLELGYREDYFPRKVKDVDGFLSYMRGLEDWTRYQEALREADPENVFTPEEQAEFINKYMRGFVRVDLMPVKYGSEKQRKVPIVNNEINRFYAPSIDSYVSYIEGMNARIESAKFLGKDSENYDESIGGYLTYLQEQNLIKPNQIDEVRDILRARFGQRGVSNRFLGTARDLSYIYTMGGINSAITQIEDLSVSMYKAGVWNTLTTMFSGKEITRKDIGVENVSQEFVSQKKTSKWLNGLFKATGLDAIDGFGKETLINSIIKKYKQIYEKNPQALRDYLEPIMEDQTSSVINDILNGTKSDNLMYLVFSELSDVQPVSLSELPEFYNTSGNLRVLYMLKSFMVKRIDTFRNECFDKLKSKDTSVRIEGLQNLLRLSVLMIICGATKDWIIDLLYGRKTDMSETLVNNVLGMFGISKFHLYKAREQGFSGVLKEFVVPPLFSFWDDIIGDVFDVKEGKRKLKDLEVLKGIPLFGRFYYWWIGRGAEKQKKKRGKGRRR